MKVRSFKQVDDRIFNSTPRTDIRQQMDLFFSHDCWPLKSCLIEITSLSSFFSKCDGQLIIGWWLTISLHFHLRFFFFSSSWLWMSLEHMKGVFFFLDTSTTLTCQGTQHLLPPLMPHFLHTPATEASFLTLSSQSAQLHFLLQGECLHSLLRFDASKQFSLCSICWGVDYGNGYVKMSLCFVVIKFTDCPVRNKTAARTTPITMQTEALLGYVRTANQKWNKKENGNKKLINLWFGLVIW